MTDLPGLLERVKKCEGPDRELDHLLHNSLIEPIGARFYNKNGGSFIAADVTAPNYTASTDAALGLVERVLPKWQIEQITWVPVKGGLCIASIGNFRCADDYYSATTEQPTTPPPRHSRRAPVRPYRQPRSCEDEGMTDRLQAAREALERIEAVAKAELRNTRVLASNPVQSEAAFSILAAVKEALALLQSGPDTSRESSETGQADSLRIFSDGVRSLAARLPLEEGWLKGLALALEHAARALDAAAEGQGNLHRTVALVVNTFRRRDECGYRARERRYVLDMLERFVPEHLPVSASKPEGA